MRLLIVSDLHHELWRENAPRIDPAVRKPDAVILAGDINTGEKAVIWAKEAFAGLPVFYVHGNHEAYGKNLDDVIDDIRAASEGSNVHFLHCDEVILGEVRFLGCCLWTDFKLFGDGMRQACMRESEAVMNDYRRIRLASQKYRKLRAADTARFHAEQCSWLSKKLDEPFPGKTVVVTHMAPSKQSVAMQYETEFSSAAYASNLDHLAKKADLWVHGHTHTSFDYTIGKCRVVTNPQGYMTRGGGIENGAFDPGFIVNTENLSFQEPRQARAQQSRPE